MKKASVLIMLLLSALLLAGFARAEAAEAAGQAAAGTAAFPEPPAVNRQAEAMDAGSVTEALPEAAGEVLGGVSLMDRDMGDKGFSALLGRIKNSAAGILRSALGAAAKLLAVVILCAAACSAMSEGGAKDMVAFGGTTALSVIAIDNVHAFLGLGMNTLMTLSDYSKALLPAMCTAAASAGAVTSASAKYAATAMFVDLLITISVNIILPLISVYLAAAIANALLARDSLANVAKLLKWISTMALTLLVLAFTAYLGMTGLITGKADALAAKLAKAVLGTALPVVGNIVSDTAETLVAGAGMLRNAIGVFGLLAIAAVCVAPFLNLGLHYLVYKGTAAFSNALAEKRMAALISDIGTAFGLLLALVGSAGVMLFFSVISSMKAVTAL
ncbi:MAG: stage III sporulation protein AE [Oscillospiraceae bacterium]|jgi:stage III sporulation protein AE|nr:stage III sporulation protein AE [Oscillospiraceae bacterium]